MAGRDFFCQWGIENPDVFFLLLPIIIDSVDLRKNFTCKMELSSKWGELLITEIEKNQILYNQYEKSRGKNCSAYGSSMFFFLSCYFMIFNR